MKSYRELEVWQRGMELVVACYAVAACLPREERFGLAAQLRRAAVSIPANIAEGHDRRGSKEYAHHVSVAQGSSAEVDTLLALIEKLGLASTDVLRPATEERLRVSRMLARLHAALLRSAPPPAPGPPSPAST